MPSYSIGKRFRRRRTRGNGRRLSPLAIVGICALAAILVALLVGNLLRLLLYEEALKGLTDGTPEELPTAAPPTRAVPFVRAYPFALGDSTASLTSGGAELPAALSVSVNTPNGTLTYSSPVSELQGLTGNPRVALSNSMQSLWQTVPYLCGVFYPHAPEQTGEDAIYAATLAEGALLREFARAGASEILLVGLPFDSEHLSASVAYVKEIKAILGHTFVGVAVPPSVAQSAEGWELLPSLRECADYLALDLREATEEELEPNLLNANYYVTQHQMRLLLSEEQTAYVTAAEATLSDFQIVSSWKE